MVAGLQNQLAAQAETLQQTKSDLAAMTQSHESLRNEVSAAKQAVASEQDRVRDLSGQLASSRAEADSLRPLENKVDDLMARLRALSIEHEDSLEANATALRRIDELQKQTLADADKIRSLRRERASIADLDDATIPIRKAA